METEILCKKSWGYSSGFFVLEEFNTSYELRQRESWVLFETNKLTTPVLYWEVL